jgi:hypothetical protein
MQIHIDSVARSLVSDKQDTLYQLFFVGGPFDGHVARSDTLPEASLVLASGPADCGSRVGSVIVRRLARYCWTSTRLLTGTESPVVMFRFEYRGTASNYPASIQPLWRRTMAALRRWWTRVECPVGPIAMNHLKRKVTHVQS